MMTKLKISKMIMTDYKDDDYSLFPNQDSKMFFKA